MGQVRWAGWTMTIATALVISGGVARADIASDKPAAIVVYPKIAVNHTVCNGGANIGKACAPATAATDCPSSTCGGVDTVIRLTNTNQTTPILVHCFYLDANSHCSGGTAEGTICTSNPLLCTGGGVCIPGWQEVDFRAQLTPSQPIEWKASDGLSDSRTCKGGVNDGDACKVAEDCPTGECQLGLPLSVGVCVRNPLRRCGGDADCNPFPGGSCTQSNAGTRIPGVPEDPFAGELKCIAIDATGAPIARNDLKGEALVEKTSTTDLDVASYNAIGIQATGRSTGAVNELQLGGGDSAEYNGCPNFLILDHFFDRAVDPIPSAGAVTKRSNEITTNLVFVPCSEDLLRQVPGSAVVQYLVFNEFEQRFSTSKSVTCFQDIRLCNLDTRDCSRSIFNVSVAGTLTGQTRINPIGISLPPPFPGVPSGLLGIAIENHVIPDAAPTTNPTSIKSAGFNLVMQGARDNADVITLP